MGITCQLAQNNVEEYQFIREETLPPFGFIRVLREKRQNRYIGSKQITLHGSKQLTQYMKCLQLSKEATSKVPTLLKVEKFQRLQRPECLSFTIRIEFDYVSQNLQQLIRFRKDKLHQFIHENKKTLNLPQLDKIKLYEYGRINQLTRHERIYLGFHFTEAEILRFIDHVAGSIYYLLHYEQEYGAVRPSNIMMDDDGKFLLVDRKTFKLETNYELGIRRQSDRIYVSPQEFKSLRQCQQYASKNNELSEIFSIGLVALQLANIHDNVDKIYDFECWRGNIYEMNRLLAQTKMRYSQKLTHILQKMLSFDEADRIDLDQLIELITPVLQDDIKQWESVFELEDSLSVRSSKNSYVVDKEPVDVKQISTKQAQIILKRLSQIQEQYHKVMSSKLLNDGRYICDESLRKDEERILKKLRESNTPSSFRKTHQTMTKDQYF